MLPVIAHFSSDTRLVYHKGQNLPVEVYGKFNRFHIVTMTGARIKMYAHRYRYM